MFLGDLVHPMDAGKRNMDYQADCLVDAVSPLGGRYPTSADLRSACGI